MIMEENPNLAHKSVHLWLYSTAAIGNEDTIIMQFIRSFIRNDHGFPGGSGGKESACTAVDWDLIPGLGGFPGEGNGSPLQCSGLGNPMDGGTW